MKMRSKACLLAAVSALGLTGSAYAGAFDLTVTGKIRWKDSAATLYPARDVKYDVIDSATGNKLGTARADLSGNYTFVIANDDPELAYNVTIKAYADNDATFVSSDFTAPNTFTASTATTTLVTIGGPATANFDIPNTNDAGKAFSVADALLTGWQYSGVVRAANSPKIPDRYPTPDDLPDNPSFSYFLNAANGGPSISTRNGNAYDEWDEHTHEYGHYLESQDKLASYIGGQHTFGAPTYGASPTNAAKTNGVQLSWSEGLATYLGTAAQQTAVGAAFNRPGVPNVGDAKYTAYGDGGGNFGLNVLLSDNDATASKGEGDEAAVARIVFCLADGVNGSWDRVSRGHVQVYKDLVNAAANSGGTLQSLSQFNNYMLSQVATTLKQRVDIGAIFEHFNVSPHPHDGLIGQTLAENAAPPTVVWDRQNNDANDQFRILFMSTDFTSVLSNILVPTDTTSYTLTADQWNLLINYKEVINFVVIGSDLKTGATAFTGLASTGNYWSDAYQFTVIPEPSALLGLAVPCLLLGRRRR